MLVVDNSSLSALNKINRLDLLLKLFDRVIIPYHVVLEFSKEWQRKILSDKFDIKKNIAPISEDPLKKSELTYLGDGEKDAIAWCIHYEAILATDDKKVRKYCETQNLKFIGTLGICKQSYFLGFFENKEQYTEIINLLAQDLYLSEELIDWAKNV